MNAEQDHYLGYYPTAELVFAMVCPLGADYHPVVTAIGDYLSQFGYHPNVIRISDLFGQALHEFGLPWQPPTSRVEMARYKMDAGNRLRKVAEKEDFLALLAAGIIASGREVPTSGSTGSPAQVGPLPRTAHIICTLKRPEEISTLRRIYGAGLFVIGISATREDRKKYFSRMGITESEAKSLIDSDTAESTPYGQETRKTFHLADVFVPMHDFEPAIARFLDLVFGCPTITPSPHEQSMFMAYAASLRSGDLSRQVGAAIVDPHGDLLAVGCNEVPSRGGGVYWPGTDASRDIERRNDSNEAEKNEIISRVLTALGRDDLDRAQALKLLKPTGITDLTEFGRTVHAEMEALFACARSGRSPREAVLFTTTFPCHNCCRHIIAAGITRVVWIVPEPQNNASPQHDDSVSIDEEVSGKVPFVPFLGIGPRRYFDLFSLHLSGGYPIERKLDGKLVEWNRLAAKPRMQMPPSHYLQRETLAWDAARSILSKRKPS
jgi:deoxycytidylate deaminase